MENLPYWSGEQLIHFVQAESVNSFKAKIDPLIRQVGGIIWASAGLLPQSWTDHLKTIDSEVEFDKTLVRHYVHLILNIVWR